jgi:transposase
MDQLTTVGIDLAKDIFAVCVLDTNGAVLQRRVLRREAFMRWAEQLSPCRVAMEACGVDLHGILTHPTQ